MLRLPEGKASKGLLQAEIDAFGSKKDVHARHNAYGRSIATNEKRLQIYINDLRPFYETYKSVSNENPNRS